MESDRIASSTRNVGSMIAPSTACPSIAARTRPRNRLLKPLGMTRPNVFGMPPRPQFLSFAICDITQTWCSRPLTDRLAIVEMIAATSRRQADLARRASRSPLPK